MVEIIRERTLAFEEDLKRDFRPLEVREGNFTYRVAGPDMKIRIVHRRQRKVLFVDPRDVNRLCEIVEDLGPATMDDPWVMPCQEGVEWAQAVELFEWAKRKRAEMEARRAIVKPLRDEAFLLSVQAHYEEAGRRASGLSSFGPYQRIQRES